MTPDVSTAAPHLGAGEVLFLLQKPVLLRIPDLSHNLMSLAS